MEGFAGYCDVHGLAGGQVGGQAGWRFWPPVGARKRPEASVSPRGHPHTHFNVLHIQELLPHNSIGLQPDWYFENA
jgi:hypothetical protein